MGEAKRRVKLALTQALGAMAVDTPGGRIHVQWDHTASASPNAQLTFFAEFLATTGIYESWVDSCPLSYNSPNAPGKRDVLGTWLLSILAGHKRYAHITGLRGDGLSPQILGMQKIISEDAPRAGPHEPRAKPGRPGWPPVAIATALALFWQRSMSCIVKPPQPHWFSDHQKLFSQSARSRGRSGQTPPGHRRCWSPALRIPKPTRPCPTSTARSARLARFWFCSSAPDHF
jgi:hypothetical protein